MTAGVFKDVALGRLPAGRPELVAVVVAEVDVAAAEVEGNLVVAIAADAAKACIAKERIAAGGVRNDAEVGLTAQVIHPGQRSVRLGNYVFPIAIVEISVLH